MTVDGDTVALSTGETVRVPLETAATATGVFVTADRAAVAALLPDSLRPVRVTPTRAAVAVLAVEYHRIGADAVAPYDELAVALAATPRRSTPQALATGDVGGYVHTLPVTHAAARALGVEVWGFPKTVARIAHHDDGRRRTTSVVDGDHLLTLAVSRPRTVPASLRTTSYAVDDGRLDRIPVEITGRVGVAPLSARFDLMLGTHDRAAPLRSLDFGERALARVAFEGEVTYGAGQAVDRA